MTGAARPTRCCVRGIALAFGLRAIMFGFAGKHSASILPGSPHGAAATGTRHAADTERRTFGIPE
jgi:hypothetical protein